MTKLQAVNLMLSKIGERAVSSLDTTLSDAYNAEIELDRTSESLQVDGYSFNTEYGVDLVKDINGNITAPTNSLAISNNDRLNIITVRGQLVYSMTDKSFIFTKDLKCDVVSLLTFEDLPEYAKQYVAYMAARTFQQSVMNDPSIDRGLAEQVDNAANKFFDNEEFVEGNNMVNSDHSLLILARR